MGYASVKKQQIAAACLDQKVVEERGGTCKCKSYRPKVCFFSSVGENVVSREYENMSSVLIRSEDMIDNL